jgi:hypothetical protein
MGLADRLGPKRADGARDDSDPNASGSFIVNNGKRKADLLSEGARRLKIKVHNRLFETIDISKLESLDPSLVSSKVILAITDILSEDGRLLTDADAIAWSRKLRTSCWAWAPWSHSCAMTP